MVERCRVCDVELDELCTCCDRCDAKAEGESIGLCAKCYKLVMDDENAQRAITIAIKFLKRRILLASAAKLALDIKEVTNEIETLSRPKEEIDDRR